MIAGPSEVLIVADRTGNAELDRRRSSGAGRARHRARRRSSSPTTPTSPPRSSGRSTPARALAAGGDRRRVVARLRRGDSWCASLDEAVALVDAIAPEHLEIAADECRAARRAHPQCRRDLHRRAHAGGDRRLRRRLEPRVADRALGAVFLRARRARFHEAHLDPQMRPGAIARARRRRDRARRGRRASTPTPARWRSGSTADGATAASTRSDTGRLVAVTLDEVSIGRSNRDVEHERAVAIYDLIEENSFRPARPRRRPLRAHNSASAATAWSSTSAQPTARR